MIQFAGTDVAPFTGAWVEMTFGVETLGRETSHPSRVRGLK